MRLSETDQSLLLKHFPNVELSYETLVHKKVYSSDFVLAIPEGRKHFAWFTTFKTQNVCILLEITENKQICRIEIVNTCFHGQLSYGTVFYGTTFKYKNARYFCTEDIYYYKGVDVSKKMFSEKLDIFKTIYSGEIKQKYFFESSLIFGLPLISNLFQNVVGTVELLPYKIKYIQFRNTAAGDSRIYNMEYTKQNHFGGTTSTQCQQISGPKNDLKREIVFKITPDIQNDIYHLHYYDPQINKDSTENIFDVAYIPDYKTSVMMNKLFRNIKENANLDALEESDDEDEFEDDRPDKFVFLNKSYNMVCVWNNKFKKWAPIRLAQKGDKIITKKELSYYERK
jgi:hypothetical protein